MNREKQIEETYIVNNEQIEEMANFLWKNTLIHTEDLCHDVSETCYNAGYRKQSEGEWLNAGMFGDMAKCSVCGLIEHSLNEVYSRGTYKYCPNCGAKMKGGAE